MEIDISNRFIFSSCYSDKVTTIIQSVILTATIVSSNHVDKIVVNTKGGMGTWMKGKDEPPQWFITAASRHEDPGKGTVHTMIRDWKDVEKSIFWFKKRVSSRGRI